MTARRTFHVRLWRDPEDQRFWLAQADEDEHAHTFGRNLAHAKRMAVDVIALWFELEPDDFDVEWEISVSPELDQELERLRARREELASLGDEVNTLQRDLAWRLTSKEGLSYRDAAELLGLSHQRVAQLVT
ncbi:MAG: hypothetical protein M3O70_12485 [Actinomycetota bacterium]|nr:hypothetical protein [Actinomycetota bacterium]